MRFSVSGFSPAEICPSLCYVLGRSNLHRDVTSRLAGVCVVIRCHRVAFSMADKEPPAQQELPDKHCGIEQSHPSTADGDELNRELLINWC